MLQLSERDTLSGRSGEDKMDYVLDDISWSYSNNVPNTKTFFYSLVQAGNIHFIRQVLSTMKFRNMADEHLWLLQLDRKLGTSGTRGARSQKSFIRKTFAGFVTAIAWIILTPGFYIFHLLSVQVVEKTRRSLSQHITLPLAFAALSQNSEMLKLFKEYNVPLDQKDTDGNNVFHYICDMSTRDSDLARKAYRTVLQTYGDGMASGLGQWCIVEELNNIGRSPLEMAFHTASLGLLNDIVKTEGILKKTVIRIEDGATESGQKCTAVCEVNQYDVTNYECWGKVPFAKKDSLLVLLSHRNYFDSAEEDIRGLKKNSSLDSWQLMKIRAMVPFTCLLMFLDLAFTCLLLVFLVGSGGDQDVVPLAPEYNSLYQAVVEARKNVSTTPANNQQLCPPTNLAFEKVSLDECEKEAFETLLKTCPSMDGTSVLIATGHFGITKVLIFGQMFVWHTADVFVVLSVFYLTIDVSLRLIKVYHKFADKTVSLRQALYLLMGRKLPVSYLNKTLNCALCVTLLVYYAKFRDVRDVSLVGYPDMSSYVESIRQMSSMMVFILLLRAVSHIYSLQLMPGMGHFVRITFAMATTLLRFMVIYTFVLLAFGTIFHFIMRDPDCPAQKVSEFVTLSGSCFATFKLMLGQGNFYYDINDLVRAVYVCYTVICSILLLNMIIGIMGIVVSQLSAEPWIWAVWRMRLLGEALNTDALTQLFLWPFSRLVKQKLLQKTGFLVQRDLEQDESMLMSNFTTIRGTKRPIVVIELRETFGEQIKNKEADKGEC